MAAETKQNKEGRRPRPTWPEWVDDHRYTLALVPLLLFFALYAFLVYTSGLRELESTEQLAVALIGITASSALGALIGLPFAKRRIKIGSQLRRAYGIYQGLRNAKADLRDAVSRMEARSRDNATSQAQLWDEVVRATDSALTHQIAEALRIAEDWGELDPSEHQRIRQAEERREEEIQLLRRDLVNAKALESDLEGVADLRSSVEHIEALIRDLRQAPPASEYVAGRARGLVDQGLYQQALNAYTEIIRRYPSTHTNYIGRARAYYLAGNKEAALADLAKAETMHAEDPAINDLRRQILASLPLTVPLIATAREEAFRGNEALSLGNADQAMAHFKAAEELGWRPHYSAFNRAMARCLNVDLPGVSSELALLDVHEGTSFEINVLGLRAITARFVGVPSEEVESTLTSKLAKLAYDYSRSPLKFLEAGLRAKDLLEPATQVFVLLRGETKAQAGL